MPYNSYTDIFGPKNAKEGNSSNLVFLWLYRNPYNILYSVCISDPESAKEGISLKPQKGEKMDYQNAKKHFDVYEELPAKDFSYVLVQSKATGEA